MRSLFAVVLIGGLSFTAGCTLDDMGPAADTMTQAVITRITDALLEGGDIAYKGDGFFRTMPASLPRPGPKFSMQSTGIVDGSRHGFYFDAAARPAEGSYELRRNLDDGSLIARYERWNGTAMEVFVSDSGTLTLDASSEQ